MGVGAGGVNKQFCQATERSCTANCCENDSVAIPYFNKNFKEGWQNLLDSKQLDLHDTGMNNATNAFRQTGSYPFDPNCKSWSSAIETLGLANDNKKGKV